MIKQKIYIETSVISYLTARPSRNLVIAAHHTSTSDFWQLIDQYEVFISDIVIQEASRGDVVQAKLRSQVIEEFPVLEIDDEIKTLAREFIENNIIPKKCPEDALHIAVAAANGMDLIVTWNFKHINNPFVRKKIRQAVEEKGWNCPEICSPQELLGDEL